MPIEIQFISGEILLGGNKVNGTTTIVNKDYTMSMRENKVSVKFDRDGTIKSVNATGAWNVQVDSKNQRVGLMSSTNGYRGGSGQSTAATPRQTPYNTRSMGNK